jgi:hypothetical protein
MFERNPDNISTLMNLKLNSPEPTPLSVIASVAKQSSIAYEINKGLICAK